MEMKPRKIYLMDAITFMERCIAAGVQVDLFFSDPPYGIANDTVIVRKDCANIDLRFGDWDVFKDKKAFFEWTFSWVEKANLLLRPGGIFVSFFDRAKINYLTDYLVDNHHYKIKNNFAWCLASGTKIFARINGKYELLTIRELYERRNETIFVPTQDFDGKNIWIRVKSIFDNGKKETLKVTTKSGGEVICTPDHEIVFKAGQLQGKFQSKYKQTRTIKAKELGNSSKIYMNVITDVDLPDGDQKEYDDGYFVGFYIAEGSKARRENGKLKGIQLSCGVDDIKRGYIDKLKGWELNQYIYPSRPNDVHLRCNGSEIIDFINEFVDGDTCDMKRLKNTAFNRSKRFLLGIVDGFLEGDGHYDEKNDRWRIGIKPNVDFKDQLQLICRILGFAFRYIGIRPTGNGYIKMDMTIRKNRFFNKVVHGCIVDSINSVIPNGIKDVYDLEVEELYDKDHPLRSKYYVPKYVTGINNLYFLANGIWTHNCKPNPAPQFRNVKWSVGWETAVILQKPSGYDEKKKSYLYQGLTFNYQLGQHPDYVFAPVISGSERRDCTIYVMEEVEEGKEEVPDKDQEALVPIQESYGKKFVKKRVVHPTQKPLAVLYPIINYWTNKGDSVLDPFCGVASIPFACETVSRKWYACDNDKTWVKIGRKRMEKLAGITRLEDFT